MKAEKDYLQDISEIRSIMERSSKFLSLSGLAGVLAGIYATIGASIMHQVFEFNPDSIQYVYPFEELIKVQTVALIVLLASVVTAILLSTGKAHKKGEKVWNLSSKRMLFNFLIPLVAGGLLSLIFLSKGFIGLLAPTTLLFYGMALFSAGFFTFGDVKYLGLIQITLGLLGFWLVDLGMLLWTIGFGITHIVYGAYMHFKYER